MLICNPREKSLNMWSAYCLLSAWFVWVSYGSVATATLFRSRSGDLGGVDSAGNRNRNARLPVSPEAYMTSVSSFFLDLDVKMQQKILEF